MCSNEVGRNATLRGKMFVKPAFAAKSAVINSPQNYTEALKHLFLERQHNKYPS